MKILVISDLHYEMRVFKGVDESVAWKWLLELVDYHKPEYLLSCGDWGLALNTKELYELLEKTVVLTIYGNHENIGVLKSARNLRARLPVLIRDGRVYEVGELRVAGISGVISERRRATRDGVSHKTPEEYISIAYSLKDKGVDILLIHEVPYIPELLPAVKKTASSMVVLEAIEIVKPKLVIGGHVHRDCPQIYTITTGVDYICVDSSQLSKQYLIIRRDRDKTTIEKWVDREKQFEAPWL